jgi:hypothetical protein
MSTEYQGRWYNRRIGPRAYGILLLVLVVAAIASWATRPTERTLEGKGLETSIGAAPAGFVQTRDRGWYSDRELLVEMVRAQDLRPGQMVVENVETHARRELKGLAAGVRRIVGQPVQLSPDRKWLLCHTTMHSDRITEIHSAVSVDGKRVVQWPPAEQAFGGYVLSGWMPDSRTFARMTQTGVLLFRINAPKAIQRTSAPPMREPYTDGHVLADGRFFLAHYASPGPASEAFLYTFQPTAPRQVREVRVALPGTCQVTAVRANRQGTRLAWQLTFDDSTGPYALLRYLLVPFGRGPHSRTGIWVSDLEGRGMREVGHVHGLKDIGLREWLPGGKSVAYYHLGKLYRLPVE